MKVAVIIDNVTRISGVQKVACELIEKLSNQGHEVTVFCQSADILVEGVNYYFIPKISDVFFVNHFAFSIRLKHILKKSNFDIIHDQILAFPYANVSTIHSCHKKGQKIFLKRRLRLFKKTRHIKWLIEIVSPSKMIYNAYVNFILRKSWRYSQAVIAVSDTLLEDLHKFYGKRKKISFVCYNIVGNGLDNSKISEDKVFHTKKILCVTNRLLEKNVDILIDAFKMRAKKGSGDLIIIGGNQVELNYLEKISSISGDNVFFLGVKSNVSEYYKSAYIFTLLSEYESFGLVFLEALNYGVPVIMYESLPLATYIKNYNAGWLVKNPCDANEVSNLIDSVLELRYDEYIKKREGARLLAKALNSYNFLKKHIDIYENLKMNKT